MTLSSDYYKKLNQFLKFVCDNEDFIEEFCKRNYRITNEDYDGNPITYVDIMTPPRSDLMECKDELDDEYFYKVMKMKLKSMTSVTGGYNRDIFQEIWDSMRKHEKLPISLETYYLGIYDLFNFKESFIETYIDDFIIDINDIGFISQYEFGCDLRKYPKALYDKIIKFINEYEDPSDKNIQNYVRAILFHSIKNLYTDESVKFISDINKNIIGPHAHDILDKCNTILNALKIKERKND